MTDRGQVFMNLSSYIESSSTKPSRTAQKIVRNGILGAISCFQYTVHLSAGDQRGARTTMREKS